MKSTEDIIRKVARNNDEEKYIKQIHNIIQENEDLNDLSFQQRLMLMITILAFINNIKDIIVKPELVNEIIKGSIRKVAL